MCLAYGTGRSKGRHILHIFFILLISSYNDNHMTHTVYFLTSITRKTFVKCNVFFFPAVKDLLHDSVCAVVNPLASIIHVQYITFQ